MVSGNKDSPRPKLPQRLPETASPEAPLISVITQRKMSRCPKVCVFVYSVQYPWAVTCIYGYSHCYSWATCPQTGPSFVSLQQYRPSLQLEGSGSWKLYARPCFSHTLKYIWVQWLDFWKAVANNLIVVLNNTVRENGKAGVGGGEGPPLGPPPHPQTSASTLKPCQF